MITRARPARRDLTDAQAVGMAIKRLRERAEMTQQEAADRMGITAQAWQRYEAGDRQIVLRSDVQGDIAAAVHASPEVLRQELAMIIDFPGGKPVEHMRNLSVPVWGRAKAGAAGALIYDVGSEPEHVIDLEVLLRASVKSLRVAGDSMTGYVESGQLVVYDQDRWPRRGDGCVVVLKNGEVVVKEYDKSDGSTLFVRQRFPEQGLNYPMAEVAGVYAIIARLSL